jgi:hypothetical protein
MLCICGEIKHFLPPESPHWLKEKVRENGLEHGSNLIDCEAI